jgi:phenol/toluene 2-monooxygenase (NADH) P4/A4
VSVAALGAYQHPSHDGVAAFAHPLLYVAWDLHMVFAAPLALLLAPQTLFGDLRALVLPRLYGAHPDFARIDWSGVQWFRDQALFTPDWRASIAAHGLAHKSVLRFRTPGLEGLRGSAG